MLHRCPSPLRVTYLSTRSVQLTLAKHKLRRQEVGMNMPTMPEVKDTVIHCHSILYLRYIISNWILMDHCHLKWFHILTDVWTVLHIGRKHSQLQISRLRLLLTHLSPDGLQDLEFPPSSQLIEEDSLNPIFGSS